MTKEGPDTARQKLEAMREILDLGIAMVHLDPRRDGVQVPERFRKDPVLRLNFAYGFRLPALTIDDEGIYAILNFQGERAACNIPWAAVFAITAPEHEHNGRLWPEDVPEEVVSELVAQASRARMHEVGVTETTSEQTRPDKPRARRAKKTATPATKPLLAPAPSKAPGPSTPGQAPDATTTANAAGAAAPAAPAPATTKSAETKTPARPRGHLRVVK